MKLPGLSGSPIHVQVRPSLGPHHAASSIPKRIILLDSGLLSQPGEFDRILMHELFHFVWVRLSNQTRRDWELLLTRELRQKVRGELGWSAEWRKHKLSLPDALDRTPSWRCYVCESFCDTAAWLYADLRSTDPGTAEFTLRPSARPARRRWFAARFPADALVRI